VPKNSKPKNPLPIECLICGKLLTLDGIGDEQTNPYAPPLDATVWRSDGNYGTELYDPCCGWSPNMESEHLEAYICDACLRKRKAKVQRRIYLLKEPAVVPTGKTIGKRKRSIHKVNPKYIGEKTLVRVERWSESVDN